MVKLQFLIMLFNCNTFLTVNDRNKKNVQVFTSRDRNYR